MKTLHPLDQYQFEKAKALAAAGSTVEAERIYRALLEKLPDDPRILNNLGTLLEGEGRSVEAEWAYRKAIAAEPDLPLLHYNLAHLLQVDGRLEMAEASYRRAAELAPDHLATWFNLGLVLCDLGRFDDAAAAFERAGAIDPASAPAASCHGSALYEAGRFEAALEAFRRALDLVPDDPEALFNVAKTLEALGRREEAAAVYVRSLSGRPDSVATRESLGRTLHSSGHTGEAVAFLREWLSREPGHPVATHMLASITGEGTPERASDAYLRDVFDRFAGDFDTVLKRLGYVTPEALVSLFVSSGAAARSPYDILDAGCGTGLCGPLFRPFARRLVGLDISSGMLARAAERGVYDEMVEAELTAHLAAATGRYDVILSADTLVYFGALEAVMATAAGALRPGGHFLFSVERLEGDDAGGDPGHRLNPNGRFAHRAGYVRRVLESSGFRVQSLETAALRREAGAPVIGLLVLADRPENPS